MKEPQISPIVFYGSQILRQICIEAENNEETKYVVDCLLQTMANIPTAVGLAAPQINSKLNIFVMKPHTSEPMVVINPKILKEIDEQVSPKEGCLSIPGIYWDVPRAKNIEVEFWDENFKKHRLKFKGFHTTVFLHEFDHLNGILFIDRITKEGKESIKDKLSDLANGKYIQKNYDMILNDKLILKNNPIVSNSMSNPTTDSNLEFLKNLTDKTQEQLDKLSAPHKKY